MSWKAKKGFDSLIRKEITLERKASQENSKVLVVLFRKNLHQYEFATPTHSKELHNFDYISSPSDLITETHTG